MRKICVTLLTFIALGVVSAHAVDIVPMDSDLMLTIEETNDSLSSNIAMEEGEVALMDAEILSELFASVETHYKNEPDSEEAYELTLKSNALIAHIIEQVKGNDFESAANSATDLARTCKSCHNFYKED